MDISPPAPAYTPWIVCAAVCSRDHSKLVCAPRHFDPTMRAQMKADPTVNWTGEQGFVDQRGVFYNRVAALRIARANGQIRRPEAITGEELFSEALY